MIFVHYMGQNVVLNRALWGYVDINLNTRVEFGIAIVIRLTKFYPLYQ